MISLGTIPEDLALGQVYEFTLSAAPATIVGRRALYDELIWDLEGGFAPAWADKSSLVELGEDSYTLVLGRRAYSIGGISVHMGELAEFSGGGGGEVDVNLCATAIVNSGDADPLILDVPIDEVTMVRATTVIDTGITIREIKGLAPPADTARRHAVTLQNPGPSDYILRHESAFDPANNLHSTTAVTGAFVRVGDERTLIWEPGTGWTFTEPYRAYVNRSAELSTFANTTLFTADVQWFHHAVVPTTAGGTFDRAETPSPTGHTHSFVLTNTSTTESLTIVHNNLAVPSASNRLITYSGADVIVPPWGSVRFVHAAAGGWKVFAA